MQINSSINYIKNKVETYGLQRSNRFEVSITRNGQEVANSIPIFSVQFPNKSVGVIGDFTTGPNIGRNVPINFDYDKTSSLLMTMAIDAKWTNYKAINDWVEDIVNDDIEINISQEIKPYLFNLKSHFTVYETNSFLYPISLIVNSAHDCIKSAIFFALGSLCMVALVICNPFFSRSEI